MGSRLRERYQQEVGPVLLKEFGYKNPMQLPNLHKIVLNIGLDLGVISPTLFAMMVVMALATTAATAPVLHWLIPSASDR